MRRTPIKRTLKPKVCRWCRETFTPGNSSQVCCKPFPCAVEYGKRKTAQKADRELKAKERAYRAETRRRKEAIKSLSTLCSELQKIVNEYARLSDIAKGHKCISCGVRDVTDAGHFYHAGSKYRTSRLRFNLLGLNGQCEHCNRYSGGGNHRAYEQGLVARYGEGHLAELEDAKLAADRGEEQPLTKDEVRAMKKEFRRMIRELKTRHK